MLPKDLYSRVTCWMADREDPSLLEEAFDQPIDIDEYLMEEAYDIMYQIHLLEIN
jgi:hypothetical protein